MINEPTAPEGDEHPGPQDPASPAAGSGQPIDFIRWLAEGWRLIRDDLVGYVIATIILLVIGIVAWKMFKFFGLVLLGPFQAGFFLMVANHMRTGRPLIGDLFQALSRFLPLLLASLLIAIGLAVGAIACFVGTIFGMGIWMFTFLFIVDRGMDFWEAMEASRHIAGRDYLEFSLFALVLVVLNAAGFLAIGVGALITIPLSFASVTCAYRELIGLAPEPAVTPPVPPVQGPQPPEPPAS